jgi:NAD(P)-dependent dehydrogenase (short-subunit alcohol dehydrogenase family)
VSSLAHRFGKIKKDDINSEKSYSEVHGYSQSKLANVLFTRELSRRLKGTGVTVNCLHPGTINTNLSRHMNKMSLLFNKFLVKPFLFLFFKTPKAGAQTTVFAGKVMAGWEEAGKGSKVVISRYSQQGAFKTAVNIF